MLNQFYRFTGLVALLLSTACAYRVEVQQGNVVVQSQVAQLQIGMEQQRVRYLLGTPLLTDPFHARRWDYLFDLRSDDRPNQHYHLALYFDAAGRLERLEQQGEFPTDPYVAGGQTLGLE